LRRRLKKTDLHLKEDRKSRTTPPPHSYQRAIIQRSREERVGKQGWRLKKEELDKSISEEFSEKGLYHTWHYE